jgi:N-acetylglucosaminyldiphosphoundecaprenol N-acetyl-beta-D-mannosaminyltransferase
MTRNRVGILGVPIDVLHPEEILTSIDRAVATATPSVYAYTNIHTINMAYRHPGLQTFLNSAELNILDGKGVQLGGWLLGVRTGPALGITRLIWDILAHCEQNGLGIFLLGSTEETLSTAIRNLQARFPRLHIAGRHHGYFHEDRDGSTRVIREISVVRPAIVFVGFGTPLQEEWVANNRTSLAAPVTMLVGGCIEIIAGKLHAAPVWVVRIGLEWLYRLLQEPQRLWRRYVIGIPLFFGRITIERIRGALHIPSIRPESAHNAAE